VPSGQQSGQRRGWYTPLDCNAVLEGHGTRADRARCLGGPTLVTPNRTQGPGTPLRLLIIVAGFSLCSPLRALAMIDSAVLYVSIGSLLVAIGSLVVSIAARQEARHHTVFTPRTQALDHLRIAVNDIKKVRRVTPAAVLIMRDAKSRADLAFDEKVRSDFDRVIQIADRLQFQLVNQHESEVDALLRDLDQITQRMTAACR